MNLLAAHPYGVVLILPILAALAGTFLPVLTLGRKRSLFSPGVRQARRLPLREEIQAELHRFAADATRRGEEQIARFLDRCALALAPGYDLPGFVDYMHGWQDSAALLGEAAPVAAPPPPWDPLNELPVFRAGNLVGYLTRVDGLGLQGAVQFPSGVTFRQDQNLKWTTTEPDCRLAKLPRESFRHFHGIHPPAIGILTPPGVRP